MSRSGPTLHPPVLKDQADIDLVKTSLSLLADHRRQKATPEIALSLVSDLRIPIDSVSKDGTFDAYIHIGFLGGAYPNVKLRVDSGNSTLIVPDYNAISQLPNFNRDYHVENGTVKEPWGAYAKIVTGPIVLPRQGGTYTIPNCRFYACTGVNDRGCRTANFGIGRVDPWTVGDAHGVQSPLSYSPDFGFCSSRLRAHRSGSSNSKHATYRTWIKPYFMQDAAGWFSDDVPDYTQ